MGVVLKRAKYFILCNGKYAFNFFNKQFIERNILLEDSNIQSMKTEQLRLF